MIRSREDVTRTYKEANKSEIRKRESLSRGRGGRVNALCNVFRGREKHGGMNLEAQSLMGARAPGLDKKRVFDRDIEFE